MAQVKLELLRQLSFGQRVAEDEADHLSSYFVETEQWRKVATGEIDVIFGTKGAGKSAIYSTLLQRDGIFFDNGIILIAAENPRGTPAFRDLIADPPTSEQEFVALWKFYILSLIGTTLVEYDAIGDAASEVRSVLAREKLLPAKNAPLRTRIISILSYVRRSFSLQAEVKLDPVTGSPVAIGGNISLSEPTAEEIERGVVSIDSLLALANRALAEEGISAWILFDRLDVAFAESRKLEANGLRALFKCYLDLLAAERIRLKIFLRSDIWKSITQAGFREASHITRHMTISWGDAALLNLMSNRVLQNHPIARYYGYNTATALSASQQRALFNAMVPEKVDAGKNPKTFEWILGRVRDGTGTVAPREVIHLLSEARDAQIAMLERGEDEPPNSEIFTRQAFRDALFPVSKSRLEQTIYAEYPELREHISDFEEEKTAHSLETLTDVWGCDVEEARTAANSLVEIGFFERRGDKENPRFWVPFIYRPALSMIQGSAQGLQEPGF